MALGTISFWKRPEHLRKMDKYFTIFFRDSAENGLVADGRAETKLSQPITIVRNKLTLY